MAGKIKASLLGKISKPVDIVFLQLDDLEYGSPFVYEITQNFRLLFGREVSSILKRSNVIIAPLRLRGVTIGWKIAE